MSCRMIDPIWLVAVSLAWQPVHTAHELDMRLTVAAEIASTDADEGEAVILMRLGYTESRYSKRVARCAKGTTSGGRGTFQVIPRNADEWRAVCTLDAAAGVALVHVRESRAACAHLPPREQLAVYAAGKCSSKKGRALSRDRVPSSVVERDIGKFFDIRDRNASALVVFTRVPWLGWIIPRKDLVL